MAVLAITLSAFAAAGAVAASAEEDAGSPSILCLVAGCSELKAELKGTTTSFKVLKGEKFIESSEVSTPLTGCKEVTGSSGKDISLCNNTTITFKGWIVTGTTVKCNTEGDAAGTVKMKVDLHVASETSTGGVLQPLLLARLLNSKEEFKEITIKCGAALTELFKGTIGCLLLPGLANVATTGTLEVVCKVKTTGREKDPETGTCKQLCEWLTAEPFQANLGGGFEDAWMEFKVTGSPSKDIFIDD
jgi:hypothetical protein